MKANESPEKLYLIQHNGLICYCRNNDEDIEYTRTDAFIEKACEWFEERQAVDLEVPNIEKFINDFKKAMEEHYDRRTIQKM